MSKPAAGVGVNAPPYFLSPQTLRIESCRCLLPRDPPTTSIATIDYMLRRMDKLWSRMRGTHLDPKVRLASERLLLELRRQGMELFHLVGMERDRHVQGNKSRDIIAIMLMVPDWGAVYSDPMEEEEEQVRRVKRVEQGGEDRSVIACGYGHRIVAEILVFFYTDPKRPASVDRVYVRLAQSWSDTITIIEHEYFRDENEPPESRIPIPTLGDMTGQQVVSMVWTEVGKRMTGEWVKYEREFGKRLGRVASELGTDGLVVTALEVEKVLKKVDDKMLVPTIRVAVRVMEAKEIEEGDSDPNDDLGREENGAVMLLECRGRDLSKIKHMMVAYEGEWPVVHRYDFDKDDEPALPGLVEMITI